MSNQRYVDELGRKVHYTYDNLRRSPNKRKGPSVFKLDPMRHQFHNVEGHFKARSFSRVEFEAVLLSMYNFTMDAWISGNLEKPDGTFWDSSAAAVVAWGDYENLNPLECSLIFRANDQVEPYT